MKVKDLIKKLQQCNPDAIFCIQEGGSYCYLDDIAGLDFDPTIDNLERDEVPHNKAAFIVGTW